MNDNVNVSTAHTLNSNYSHFDIQYKIYFPSSVCFLKTGENGRKTISCLLLFLSFIFRNDCAIDADVFFLFRYASSNSLFLLFFFAYFLKPQLVRLKENPRKTIQCTSSHELVFISGIFLLSVMNSCRRWSDVFSIQSIHMFRLVGVHI